MGSGGCAPHGIFLNRICRVGPIIAHTVVFPIQANLRARANLPSVCIWTHLFMGSCTSLHDLTRHRSQNRIYGHVQLDACTSQADILARMHHVFGSRPRLPCSITSMHTYTQAFRSQHLCIYIYIYIYICKMCVIVAVDPRIASKTLPSNANIRLMSRIGPYKRSSSREKKEQEQWLHEY